MKKIISNFLTSAHSFGDNDSLQELRFSLLNSLLLVAVIFALINYFAFILGFIVLSAIYAKAVLLFASICGLLIYLLRIKKNIYQAAVLTLVASGLSLFYFALITSVQDEFRLIWFFITLFVSFMLLGKKYGLLLMIVILTGIYYIETHYGIGLSKLALFTFFNSFIIFAAFSYFFLHKIENDAIHFQLLNKKLADTANKEKTQREEQEQMLLRQCRMANMGEMLDSIAHQWRQPLMHINSILMNMDNALEAKEDKKKYLNSKIDEVASLTTHMSQTIEDFRSLFRVENEQDCFRIDEAVNDVLTLMKNGFNNINVMFNTQNTISILGYRSELIQVIIILLSNSVEALNKYDNNHKEIIINVEDEEKHMILSIQDNAGGIEPESLANVFDPYFTTKKQSGGTGLGLYIAKIIVEHKMNGKISVDNSSTGAIFTLKLNKNTS